MCLRRTATEFYSLGRAGDGENVRFPCSPYTHIDTSTKSPIYVIDRSHRKETRGRHVTKPYFAPRALPCTVNTRHVRSHCMVTLDSSGQKLAKDLFSVKEHHKLSLAKSRMGITSSFSFIRKSPVTGARFFMKQILRTKLKCVVAMFLVMRSQETDYGVIWSLVTCMNLS